MTVARSLGRVHDHYSIDENEQDQDKDPHELTPAFVLEFYPSAQQHERGIAGRFINQARERRRSGAGVISPKDAWMLESVNLPGEVRLPRLQMGAQRRRNSQIAQPISPSPSTRSTPASSPKTPTRPPGHSMPMASSTLPRPSMPTSPRQPGAAPCRAQKKAKDIHQTEHTPTAWRAYKRQFTAQSPATSAPTANARP